MRVMDPSRLKKYLDMHPTVASKKAFEQLALLAYQPHNMA